VVHTTTTTKKSLVLFNTTCSTTSNLLGFAAHLIHRGLRHLFSGNIGD